jgi:hypothetical protein
MNSKLIPIIHLLIVFSVSNLFGQNKSEKLSTTINYVSAENVYLKTGSNSGVQIGDKFTIFRNNQVIGHVEVIYVAGNSASCKILDQSQNFQKNDAAVRTFTSPVQEVEPDTVQEKRKRIITQFKRSKKIAQPFAKLSGSVSMQWYQYLDVSQNTLGFSQPTLRLNLRARNLWGKNYNFYIKLRSRYNMRGDRFSNTDLNEKLINRIYRLGFEFMDKNSPLNFKLGRIIATNISGVGYFDGTLLQYNASENFQFGIFAGVTPQWQFSDFQTSLQKYGFFLNYTNGDFQSSRFESTLAAAGEYHGSTVSRELIYFQNRYNVGSKWNIYQSASLDINRDWRKDISGETVSVSNLYIAGRYKFSNSVSAGISIDNRKNYLTYEIRSITEELFDDATRQGLRANISIALPAQSRFSANVGLRRKQGDSESTYSYYSSLSKNNLILNNLRGSLNFAGFSNVYTSGYNPSIRLTQYFNSGHSIGLGTGSYIYSLNNGNQKRNNNWAGIDSYFDLFNRLFLTGNYEFNWGDDSEGHRILAELGYRF